nr:MAG TPA: hypothetical protein [Caudoviricetes sp.]
MALPLHVVFSSGFSYTVYTGTACRVIQKSEKEN